MSASDFMISNLFGSETLSDLTIVLQEDQPPVQQPNAVATDAHIVYLTDGELDCSAGTHTLGKRQTALAAADDDAAECKRLKLTTAAAAAAAALPAEGALPGVQPEATGDAAASASSAAAAAAAAAAPAAAPAQAAGTNDDMRLEDQPVTPAVIPSTAAAATTEDEAAAPSLVEGAAAVDGAAAIPLPSAAAVLLDAAAHLQAGLTAKASPDSAPPAVAAAEAATAALPNESTEEPAATAGGTAAVSLPAPASTSAGADATVVQKELPGHSVVLFGCSSVFRAQLQRWPSGSSSGTGCKDKLVVELRVPPGQLAVGELLLQCMYAARPDVSACSQAQLLLLLLLADRYDVPKVLAAVLEVFAGIAPADLEWCTLQALYCLPAGCSGFEAYQGVFAAAGDKLQDELGDLELTWADKQKLQLLLSLPQPALLQLLQDPRTRVASENTVFCSIGRWWQQQEQQHQPAGVSCADWQARQWQGAQELLQLVRMQHCTPLFVSTLLPGSPLASRCFNTAELLQAAVLSCATHSQQPQLAAPLLKSSSVLPDFPAWTAEKRPASAVLQLEMQWQLPLQQVQALFDRHLQKPDSPRHTTSSKHMWQGQGFLLGLLVCSRATGTDMEVFVCMTDVQQSAVRTATITLTVVAASASSASGRTHGNRQGHFHQQPQADLVCGPFTAHFKNSSAGSLNVVAGRRILAHFGHSPTWQQAEAKLRELRLVHSDGCLHLQGLVTALN